MVWIAAGAERGVAGADDGEVAVENAFAVENAAGDDVGGPGKGVDGEQTVGCGGGEEFSVRRGNEELGFVEAVEGFAIEVNDTDAKLRLIERRIGQDGGDAVGKWTFCRGGSGC